MGEILGVSCGPRYYVSTTITTSSKMLIVSLLLVREPIQIRWGITDLLVLETHPLSPGMVPNTTFIPDDTGVLPELEPHDSIAFSLAFIPVIISLLVITGLLCLHWRRGYRYSNVRMASGAIPIQRSYKRWILTWSPLVILCSIIITSIILLDISCHYLPTEATLLDKGGILPTKVYVRDCTIQKHELANVTVQGGTMECSLTSSIWFSPVITE